MEVEKLLYQARKDREANKVKQAIHKCYQALQIDSKDARAYQELARCLYRLGRYNEAANTCKRALELNPNLAIPYAILGMIYYRRGELEQGEIELRKALELDPSLEEAYVALGAVLGTQGRLEEAKTMLKKALELKPDRALTHYNLGICYSRQKEYSLALREASQAFRLSPSLKMGLGICSLSLEYVATKHRALYSLIFTSLLVLTFVKPSPLTLPLFVLLSGFLFLGSISNLKSGRRREGWMGLLLVAALAVLYPLFYIESRR